MKRDEELFRSDWDVSKARERQVNETSRPIGCRWRLLTDVPVVKLVSAPQMHALSGDGAFGGFGNVQLEKSFVRTGPWCISCGAVWDEKDGTVTVRFSWEKRLRLCS